MTKLRTFALRPWLAALLVLVLSVAGAGRGWAATSDGVEAVPVIAGVVAHICHDGADAGGSGNGTHHECCDACALRAPVLLPGTPDLMAPARVARVEVRSAVRRRAPALHRPRSPRLAQGPPLA